MFDRVDLTIPPVLIPIEDVARMLSVSTRTVRRMQANGKLPAPVRIGGGWRWRVTDLQEWIGAGCPAGGKPSVEDTGRVRSSSPDRHAAGSADE